MVRHATVGVFSDLGAGENGSLKSVKGQLSNALISATREKSIQYHTEKIPHQSPQKIIIKKIIGTHGMQSFI